MTISSKSREVGLLGILLLKLKERNKVAALHKLSRTPPAKLKFDLVMSISKLIKHITKLIKQINPTLKVQLKS